jgi:PPOX class probable F420-dependent enzyme
VPDNDDNTLQLLDDVFTAVPESHRDLLTARSTAVLTTLDGRGRPQSTAVWYLLGEDGRLRCSVTADRQKYKNLRANPHCDLFLLDLANPFRSLEIRAAAELIPDPDKQMVKAFARAYGVDEAMLAASGEGRHTVVLRPWRIVTNPPATA